MSPILTGAHVITLCIRTPLTSFLLVCHGDQLIITIVWVVTLTSSCSIISTNRNCCKWSRKTLKIKIKTKMMMRSQKRTTKTMTKTKIIKRTNYKCRKTKRRNMYAIASAKTSTRLKISTIKKINQMKMIFPKKLMRVQCRCSQPNHRKIEWICFSLEGGKLVKETLSSFQFTRA